LNRIELKFPNALQNHEALLMSPRDQEPLHHCRGHATNTKLLLPLGTRPYLRGFNICEGSDLFIA